MPNTLHCPCPLCQHDLAIDPRLEQSVVYCPSCDHLVLLPAPDERQERQTANTQPAEPDKPDQAITEFALAPTEAEPRMHAESSWPDVRIKHGPGESLAVLALLLPLVVVCVIFVANIASSDMVWILVTGAVVVTAVLLAVDAYYLGRRDLHGIYRGGAFAIFLGVVLLWIFGYPVAFFRRRHFGRPNLGLPALLVAGVFGAALLFRGFTSGGGALPDEGPPSCTSPEVVRLVDDAFRNTLRGPALKSSRDHREIHYDRGSKVRKGKCLMETDGGNVHVTYSVAWVDPKKRSFQIQIQEFSFEDPPSCSSPEVVAMVASLIKESAMGRSVKTVDGHRETRYDKANKTRYGQCTVRTDMHAFTVTYKVKLMDELNGSIQVSIMN